MTATPDPAAVERLLADARLQLVETGTRNRLVHVNRLARRGKVVDVVNERSDDVFAILRTRNRRMRFKATGRDRDAEEQQPLLLAGPDAGEEPFDERRYTDDDLETPLGPEAQAKRLLGMARDARTAEEEQGVNILYLALGFLTWFEAKSSAVERTAPLILLPVELVRDKRTARHDLRSRDDDIVTNLPLAERLRTDFGIDLPELDTSAEDWTPSAYFDLVAEAVAERPGWSVDRDGMQLGFFSFAKFLMMRDLDPANWPAEGLGDSTVVDTLLAGSFETAEPLFGPDEKLDERLQPADLIHVVDADASQTKVIEEVRAGRNLVVQGPPGTGKSQTITNIIASAVHDGKTVLFVAEKMVALNVVHEKLKDAGLASTCLELHSRTANKKAVLAELARTMNAGSATPAMPAAPDELTRLRDTLNAHTEALHASVPDVALTPHQALSRIVRFTGRGVAPPRLVADSLATLDPDAMRESETAVARYCDARDATGDPATHPFFAGTNLTLQPTDLSRLAGEAARAAEASAAIEPTVSSFAEWLERSADKPAALDRIVALLKRTQSAPEGTADLVAILDAADPARLSAALEAGIAWQKQREGASAFVDAAWSTDPAPIRSAVAAGVGSFFTRWGSRYRSASRELATLLTVPLPPKAAERLQLCDQLLAAQKARRDYREHAPWLAPTLGPHWQRDLTPFARVAASAEWLRTLRADGFTLDAARIAHLVSDTSGTAQWIATLEALLGNWKTAVEAADVRLTIDLATRFGRESWRDIEFKAAAQLFDHIATQTFRYDEWVARETWSRRLEQADLAALRDRVDTGDLDAQSARDELRFARAEAAWNAARAARPELDAIARADRHALVEAFTDLGQARRDEVRRLVAARHLSSLPRGEIGSMGVIRSEIARRRGHKPVRKLIEQAGDAIQRLKPVFLMSPISLAQFVPPDGLRFDLLVIDEASQVRPADALGAVARCSQIVVVGDKQQLPPTAFFDRMTSNAPDEEDEEIEDALAGAARVSELESILTLCEARNLSRRMLEWHYRSRDPSLIAVSNREFYDSRLILPPSPLQDDTDYGLRFVPVRGAYSSASRGEGRPGTNRIEAEAMADAVAAHARATPDISLGIVTFSSRQRDMVSEVLEMRRRTDTALDSFLREGRREDVFIKNIENVQGDERDVILVSVGYGPLEPGGRLASMSFGPVNSDGGERRLNVLFSRARLRCDIFCSFDPGDIDPARVKNDGVRIFKRFLDYAQTGKLDQSIPTGELPDSPFEEDVAAVIARLGHTVDHQVGSAGFRIDLAARHPRQHGRYMLAVECDGATYHSALWARERDRLRQSVLENLGWRFHRIWSTDWFHRREAEIARLRVALDAAADAMDEGIDLRGANHGYDTGFASDEDEPPAPLSEPIALPAPDPIATPYRTADFTISSAYEPHEAPSRELTDAVRRIVEVEGPIHEDEVARRLASAYGLGRAGSRIAAAALKALQRAMRDGLLRDGPFWFTAGQRDAPPIRDRSAGGVTRADMIAPMEIAAAADRLLADSGAAEPEELARAIARTFGFDRLGPGLRDVVMSALPGSEASP